MSTPAGWYPQPDGQQRYWDGEAWTESFAPGAPLAKAARPWFKKKRFILPIAAVVLMIIAGSLGSPPKPVTISTAAATVAAAPAVTKAAVVQPAKPKPKPKPAAPVKPVADAPAQLACGHFVNVMGDFSKGILTTAEMRTKIQEVYSNASISTNKGIPDGATAMLAAVTADDGTAFLTAAGAFMTACNALS